MTAPGTEPLVGVRPLRAAALVTLAALLSCQEPEALPEPGVGTVRDSAGITIVGHPAESETPVPRWSVVRDFRVDATTAGDDAAFGYVADVALAGDTLYVLDATAQSVSVFGADGRILRRIGGPGEGPGELSRFSTSLMLASDTVTVADWGHGRLHHFHANGAFLSSDPFGASGVRSWWRRTESGETLVRTLQRYVDEDDAWRGRDRLLRWRGGGHAVDTLLTFTYREVDLGGPGRPTLPLLVNAPTWAALSDGTIAWTSLEEGRIRLQRPGEARPTLVIEAEEWRPRAPTADDVSALMRLMGDRLVSLGGSRSVVEQLGAVPPERLPIVTTVRAGAEGTLWVQRMGAVTDAHPMMLNTPDPPSAWGGAIWDVFDPEGRRLAIVDLGPRFRVTRITDRRIVGVRWDELGRETVEVLRVVEGASATAAGGPSG